VWTKFFTSRIAELQQTLQQLGLEIGDVANQSSIAQVLVHVQDEINDLSDSLTSNYATKTSVADLSTYADSTFATKAYSDATFATKNKRCRFKHLC
jgi:hypothetical protein